MGRLLDLARQAARARGVPVRLVRDAGLARSYTVVGEDEPLPEGGTVVMIVTPDGRAIIPVPTRRPASGN